MAALSSRALATDRENDRTSLFECENLGLSLLHFTRCSLPCLSQALSNATVDG